MMKHTYAPMTPKVTLQTEWENLKIERETNKSEM